MYRYSALIWPDFPRLLSSIPRKYIGTAAQDIPEFDMTAEVEERLSKAVSQAEDVALELVRSGRLDEALGCVFGAIREALRPLVESIRELEGL